MSLRLPAVKEMENKIKILERAHYGDVFQRYLVLTSIN